MLKGVIFDRGRTPGPVSISIINAGLVISGQISGLGDIYLYGRIEGAVTCRRLFLGGDSYLKGPIEVEALVNLSYD